MIIVTYELRRRMIKDLINANDAINTPEGKQIQGESFGDFLKKQGLVPPNLLGPEYDEETMRKEYEESMKTLGEDRVDDPDDATMFEIAIINKKNKALVTDCKVQ